MKQASTQLAPRTSALEVMARRLQADPARLLDTLKATVFKGATSEELLALCIVANEHGLNPLTRQIYAFSGRDGGGIVPIVSIDGWLRIINEQPQLDGIEFDEMQDEAGNPVATTCIIYRRDRGHATKITEYYAECARKTAPWQQYPRRMLRHKAAIQCARVAFGLAGIYDPDEGRDIIRQAVAEIPAEPKRPLFEKKKEKPEPPKVGDFVPEKPALVLEGQSEEEAAAEARAIEEDLWNEPQPAKEDGYVA